MDAQLWLTLARAAEWRVDQFNEQELANTAWAFAKASQSDVALFRLLASAVERWVSEFKPQELINTAWAFASVVQSKLVTEELQTPSLEDERDDLGEGFGMLCGWIWGGCGLVPLLGKL